MSNTLASKAPNAYRLAVSQAALSASMPFLKS